MCAEDDQPQAAPGALPREHYAGPRVTVKLEPNGRYQAYHDNFRSDDRPHEHWQAEEWTGWTWFELVTNAFVTPDGEATEEQLAKINSGAAKVCCNWQQYDRTDL